MHFRSTVQLDGKTATGIRVPDEVVAALGAGNRPRVRATVAGYSYATTVARMRGEFKFPVSAEVREKAGVAAGDDVVVELELDTAPRELTIPDDLSDVLDRHPDAKEAFERLSFTNKKRHVMAVAGAVKPETRQRRLAKAIDQLRARS